MTWYVTDKRRVLAALQGHRHRLPRAHGQALPDDGGGAGERAGRARARLEIEATAVIRPHESQRSSAEGPAACTSRCSRRRPGRAGRSRSTSATAPTTPSASASCSPTRRSTRSRPTTSSPTSASAGASPTGATSTSSTRAQVMRSRRQRLLRLLARGAAQHPAGPRPRARRAAALPARGRGTWRSSPIRDLIVAADGINSHDPRAYAEHFQPSVDLRPQQVHLARLDQAARRLQVLLPRDAARRSARPLPTSTSPTAPPG